MGSSEIRELLKLKGWNVTRLAYEMDLTENTVYRWLGRGGEASGPAAVLMRLWLAEARQATAGNGAPG